MSEKRTTDDSLQKLLTYQRRCRDGASAITESQVQRLQDARLALDNRPGARHPNMQLPLDGNWQRSKGYWFDRR